METVLKPTSVSNMNPVHARELLEQMVLIRRFEERSAERYSKEKIRGFLHLYIGEEAVAVGVMQALTPADYVLSTYREHGHALARGVAPKHIMAEMYGKLEGCSRGRGGSMHLFDVSTNFYGGNAIVAGHLPISLGMALAIKKQKKNNITCCFFGEGAAAEGEFHEVMNLASLWQVPLLFVCENNLYAMGTAIRYTHAVQALENKGAAYGVDSLAVDGMNVLAVEQAAREATEKVRNTGKPFLLVCYTYRFRAHSMFDAELYREKEEVEDWKKRDPLLQLQQYIRAQQLIPENDISKIESKVEELVQQAIEYAEQGTWESIEDLTRFVYSK